MEDMKESQALTRINILGRPSAEISAVGNSDKSAITVDL